VLLSHPLFFPFSLELEASAEDFLRDWEVEVSGVQFTRHVYAKTLSILWEWLLAEATFTGVVEAPSESFAP